MTSVFSTLVILSASLLRRLIRSQGDSELTYFRPCAEFGLVPSQFVHLPLLRESIHQTFRKVHHRDIWFKRLWRFPCIGAIPATNFRLVHPHAPKFGQAHVDINSPDIPQCASPRHLILRGHEDSCAFAQFQPQISRLVHLLLLCTQVLPGHHFTSLLRVQFTKLYHNLH